MEREVRTMPISLELRRDGNNNPVCYGRAVVYNSKSNLLGGRYGFFEVIEPGFFSGVLDGDIIATIEHNCEKLVGRTSAGTLKLTDTPDALNTENSLPPTTVGNDLKINIERGEIKGMSFAFSVKDGGDKWETDKTTGVTTRTLLAGGCEGLYDVTYTCNPAYSDTSVAMRSLEKIKDGEDKTDENKRKDDPNDDLAKIEIKSNERKRQIKMAQLQ